MHEYYDYEAHYLNCKIHGSWVRCSGPKVGPMWPYSDSELNSVSSISISSVLSQSSCIIVIMYTMSYYCQIRCPWCSIVILSFFRTVNIFKNLKHEDEVRI